MTRALPLVLGVAAAMASAFLHAVPAGADGPLPEGARRRAEDAFALGVLEEVETSLRGGTSDVDLEPLRVRDAWWRPAAGATPPVPKDIDALSGRRLVWLRTGGKGPYPVAGAGETEPYPLLTALVLDRQRRETRGAARLLAETPLRALVAHSEPARYFVETLLPSALAGKPEAPDDGERSRRAETQALAVRNRSLAGAALGALLAAGAALFLLSRPRDRRPEGGDLEGGGGGAIGGGAPPRS